MISKGEARRKRLRLLRDMAQLLPHISTLAPAREGLRFTIERYLSSLPARAAIIFDRWPELTFEEVDCLARRVDPTSVCEEIVRYFQISKGTGRGFRSVCKFPHVLTVQHTLIRDIVETVFPPTAEQFLVRGKGHRAAVMSLRAAIEDGRRHILTADLRSAFSSVNIDAIYRQNIIPPSVMRSVDHRFLNLQPGGGASRENRSNALCDEQIECHNILGVISVPTGLLGGSRASNALFAWMLRGIGECAPSGSKTFVFSDNIAVAAPTEQACRNAFDNLVRFVADHPAGPFTLWHDFHEPGDSFDFLGHHFFTGLNGQVTVEPSDRNLEKIVRRIDRMTTDEAILLAEEPFCALTEARRILAPFAGTEDDFICQVADHLLIIACEKSAGCFDAF